MRLERGDSRVAERRFVAAVGLAVLLTPTVGSAQDAEKLQAPVVRTHVDAVYPPPALGDGKHGDVVLAVTVDADGHVTDVNITDSGGKDLDEAAVVAVRQWTFDPALRGAKPIASRIRVPFHFAPPSSPPEVVRSAKDNASAPHGSGASAASNSGTGTAAPSATTVARPTEVTVMGQSKTPSRGASDFTLRVGALAVVPRKSATELLTMAPGILLTNEGGEGHAEQVFLRGFDAREGQDIEFTVGGVPINEVGNLHGNGVANTHFIIPELVTSMRVVEGPFDPRQGNFAVAGSADYQLGLERRGTTLKTTVGSFGTQRLLLLWGPPGVSEGTFGGAELFTTDGFGQNRDARRGSVMGQYEGRLGDAGTYRLTGTAFADRYHSAGLLRDDDVESGRKGFFDTYDFGQGGDDNRVSIAGDIEVPDGSTFLRQQIFVIFRGMRLRENFTGFLLDPQTPLQNPHSQRGDLLDLDVSETTIGARGSSRTRTMFLGQKQEVEVGYFARGDSVQGTQRRVEGATGHPYRLETDLDSQLADLAIYIDGNLRLLRWLSVRGGVRGDLFTFNVQNNCAVASVAHPSRTNPPGDASCLSQQDFGKYRDPTQRASTSSAVLNPRASILLGPFEGFTYSLSYGEGVRSIDPSYITEDAQTPFAKIKAYEAGSSYTHDFKGVALTGRSIFFQTKVDRDLIFSETSGRNVLGGSTTRTGWVGAFRLSNEHFDEAANVTLVRSEFDDTHQLVPYVPDVVVRSDTAVLADLPFRISGEQVKGIAGLGVTYVGRRALPYGQRSDAMFTLDASATLSWSWIEVGLQATNLLGRQYRLGEYNYASDFHSHEAPSLSPVRHFSAGPPRAVFATLGITWGAS